MMGFEQSKIIFFYFNCIFSCRLFHCAPNVPHYAKNKAVGVMKPGHCFTIEPMINEGVWGDQTWPDNWTSVTQVIHEFSGCPKNCPFRASKSMIFLP